MATLHHLDFRYCKFQFHRVETGLSVLLSLLGMGVRSARASDCRCREMRKVCEQPAGLRVARARFCNRSDTLYNVYIF